MLGEAAWYTSHFIIFILWKKDLSYIEELLTDVKQDDVAYEAVKKKGHEFHELDAISDLLIELEVFRYLKKSGYMGVTFIERTEYSTPDLEAYKDNEYYLIEVKNIIHPFPLGDAVLDSAVTFERLKSKKKYHFDIFLADGWVNITKDNVVPSILFDFFHNAFADIEASNREIVIDASSVFKKVNPDWDIRVKIRKDGLNSHTVSGGLKGRGKRLGIREYHRVVVGIGKRYLEKANHALRQIVTYSNKIQMGSGSPKAIVFINWKNQYDGQNGLFVKETTQLIAAINEGVKESCDGHIELVFWNSIGKTS